MNLKPTYRQQRKAGRLSSLKARKRAAFRTSATFAAIKAARDARRAEAA